MIIRTLAVWFLIALTEVAQGYARVRWLNRRVGDRRARQIGVGTGSLLIVGTAWLFAPWVAWQTATEAWTAGLLWLVLMLAFDIGVGRWVFHASWQRIGGEFDLRRGNLLVLGMAAVLLAPWLAGRWHGWW